MSITPDLGQGNHPLCQPKWREFSQIVTKTEEWQKDEWTKRELKEKLLPYETKIHNKK